MSNQNNDMSKPKSTTDDSNDATPSGLAIHLINLFGKSAPILIVVLGFLWGAWFSYNELKIVQEKVLTAERIATKVEVDAFRSIQDETKKNNEILIKTSEQIQALVSGQIKNMVQLEVLRENMSNKMAIQQESIETSLIKKQEELANRIMELDKEKDMVLSQIKTLTQSHGEELKKLEVEKKLEPIRSAIKTITKAINADDMHSALRSENTISSIIDTEAKLVINELIKFQSNSNDWKLKLLLTRFLYRYTNDEKWSVQLEEIANKNIRLIDYDNAEIFNRNGFTDNQNKRIAQIVASLSISNDISVSGAEELLGYFRGFRPKTGRANGLEIIANKDIFFKLLFLSKNRIIEKLPDIERYEIDIYLNVIWFLDASAYHVFVHEILNSVTNEQTKESISIGIDRRKRLLPILENMPDKQIVAFWKQKKEIIKATYNERGWSSKYIF